MEGADTNRPPCSDRTIFGFLRFLVRLKQGMPPNEDRSRACTRRRYGKKTKSAQRCTIDGETVCRNNNNPDKPTDCRPERKIPLNHAITKIPNTLEKPMGSKMANCTLEPLYIHSRLIGRRAFQKRRTT